MKGKIEHIDSAGSTMERSGCET